MVDMFYLENFGIPRINDYGFKVTDYDNKSIKVTDIMHIYNPFEIIQWILKESGIITEKYLILKNETIQLFFKED